MKTLLLAAAAVVLAGPTLAWAQTAPAAPAPVPMQVQIPELNAAVADPTCGNRPALAQQAFCVTTTQAAVGALADAYSQAFAQQGWIVADGRDNLVVYVKRKPEGGCDAFQMLAFADDSRVAAPSEKAWLAFAGIPGDICAGQPAPAAPQGQ